MSVPTDVFTEPGPCEVCHNDGPCYLDTGALIAYCLPCLEVAVEGAQEQINREWDNSAEACSGLWTALEGQGTGLDEETPTRHYNDRRKTQPRQIF